MAVVLRENKLNMNEPFHGAAAPVASIPTPHPLDRGLLLAEIAAVVVLLAVAVVIGPYYLVHLPAAGRAGSLALLAGGCVLLLALLGRPGGFLLRHCQAAVAGVRFPLVIAAGILTQLAVAWLTQPVPNSDGEVYLRLAAQLSQGQPYMDDLGHRAFWPPGLPLVLSAFVALAGANLLAISLCNLFLYLVGVFSARSLGRALFSEQVGTIAALLFTFWPSRLLTAAVASKENLTMAAMLAGTAMCVRGLQRSGQRWQYAAGAGIAFGIAGLAQPGLLLFVMAMPLCYRYFRQGSIWRYLGFSAIAIGFTMLTLLPWQMRNCAQFDSQFCGVATNGGSVFYRANNPLATGEWTAEGQVPITHLPELEQNRLGFTLGKQWIMEHPGEFAVLALKKLGLLLRDDRYGAYWSVLRGGGHAHEKALETSSPNRLFAYQALHALSWVFWAIIAGVVARALGQLVRQRGSDAAGIMLPLLYPLLYSAAVFSVFESDRRQHMIALALLLVLAAWAIAGNRGQADAGRPVRLQG